MGLGCQKCGGTGWGFVGPDGYVDNGEPCPDCSASLEARKAAGDEVTGELGKPVPVPREAPKKTGQWVDAQGRSSFEDDGVSREEAGFSPAQIAAQDAADLARMQREGR